jgi:hypothetical protein
MTISTLANIVIVLLLVGWIAVRQLKWRPVTIARMWRLPLILAVIGVFETVNTANHAELTTFDVMVLAIELAVSLAVGAVMGLIAQFRPTAASSQTTFQTTAYQSDAPAPALIESRTGWFGLVLWVVMIGMRIGIDVWASGAGSTIAASTGIILVMVAVNRIARTLVMAARVARIASVVEPARAGAR